MKRNLVVAAIMMFGLVNTADAAVHSEMNSQQEKKSITADLKSEPAFLQDYIKIKNALVNDNFEQVKEAALEMQKSMEKAEINEEQRNRLKDTAVKLAKSGDIKAQRKHFAQLSQELYQLVKNNGVSGKTLYLQHCPMAMAGQGANWLSFEEQVRNPFMGQRMPGCGSVQEKIEK